MSSRTLPLAAAALVFALSLGCEPPDGPAPEPAGPGEVGDPAGEPGPASPAEPVGNAPDGGEGTPGEQPGGAEPEPAPPGTTALTFSLALQRLPRDASRLDLEVVGLSLFVGVTPTYRNADTPCDAGHAGALLPLVTTVTFAAEEGPPQPLLSVEREASRSLREAWLVLRQGLVHAGGRVYKVHAGAMCVMPDGLQYVLVRLRPPSPIALAPGAIEVVARIDGREQIVVERIDCRSVQAEECAQPDDAIDDGDADTRLRYAFARDFPILRVAARSGP